MPLYDSQLARKWTAPSKSSRDEPSTLDFLVPVRGKSMFTSPKMPGSMPDSQ